MSLTLGLASGTIAQTNGGTMLNAAPAPASPAAAQLPSDRPIGRIEPVFAFHDAMLTGVTVAADGRIFVNFPRWGDEVPFTVVEVRNGRVVAYPDAAINTFDPAHPGEALAKDGKIFRNTLR
jgi:hypothetical protein